MKNRFLTLSICLIALLFALCTDGIVGQGSGTETVGTLVDKSGTPVQNAIVILTDTSDSSQYIDSSDNNGEYKFQNMPSSIYTLWASLSDTSLATIRKNISIDSGITESIGTDTMYTPGAVTGYAFTNSIPRALIEIDIAGTSYHATTDSTGKFIMSPVLPGTYDLSFKYRDETKDIIYASTISDIPVIWDDTTNIDTSYLMVTTDGVPASPDTLYHRYDTLNENITLWWPKSKSPDILKYSVNIDDGNSIEEVDLPTDTSTTINLTTYIEEKDSATITIFIHSIDSGNNKSTVASPSIKVSVVPQTFIKTTFEWEIFPAPLDTTITNKPVKLAIKFNNPTREIDTLLWYDMSNDDTLAITYPSKKTGADTISFTWQEKGQFKIRVEGIDRAHKFWFSPIDTIHVYDPKDLRPEDLWISCSQEINNRRKEHSATVLGEKLFIFGGVIETQIGSQKMPSLLNSVEQTSLNSDTISFWDNSDTLPEYLRYTDAISTSGKIFVIGGLKIDYTVSSSIYIFDSLTSSWSTHDIMPKPLFAMSACTLNGMIYITGGRDDNYAHSNKIYMLNPQNLTCNEVGELNKAKSYHQAISDGKGIFIFGGLDNMDTKSTADVEYFTSNSPQAIIICQMPQARMFFGAEIFANKIYLIGGIDDLSTDIDGGTALNTVDIYNTETKKWIKGANLPENLHSFSTVSYDGLFFITGGCNTFPATTESKKTYCYFPFKEGRNK